MIRATKQIYPVIPDTVTFIIDSNAKTFFYGVLLLRKTATRS